MRALNILALTITIIGAINWGFVGLFDFDLVAGLFGDDTTVSNIVYSLVGLAGLVNLGLLFEMINEKDHK